MNRTERLFIIERRLQAARNAVSFEQLQEELRVSRATLNRDIKYLRDRLRADTIYKSARRLLPRPHGHRASTPGNVADLRASSRLVALRTELFEPEDDSP